MSLATLHCERCGAPVPLRVAAALECHHCKSPVAVPEQWRAAAEAHAADERVRREVEPRWQALSTGVGQRVEVAAMLLLLVLPPLATTLAQSQWSPPPSPAENLGHVAFPALLPGALLWLWAATVNATVLRVRRALRAREERPGELGCRSCGAPLAPDGDAPTATCLYCGTDSLVRDLPPAARSAAARDHSLRTLDEAVRVLRRRRVNLALGVTALGLGVAAVVAATSFSVAVALGS
jgi:DNA-directed RNA polymerase subunit RPC12/RpoP